MSNLGSFNFICILENCLRYIDYINLLSFFKNETMIYDNKNIPYFYYINKKFLHKIINSFIHKSNNRIVNIHIIESIIEKIEIKLLYFSDLLISFNINNLNEIIIKKFICNLIKKLNFFVYTVRKNNKKEVSKKQYRFLEKIMNRYI